jgi:hypothetical protein
MKFEVLPLGHASKRGVFFGIFLVVLASLAQAQTLTTNLQIPKPTVGAPIPQTQSTLRTALDQLDSATAGRLSKSVAGGSDVTLTTTEARNAVLEFTGILTGNINVIVPTKARKYIVYNNTTGAFTLTVKTSGGTGIAVTQATRVWLYCDATNVVQLDAGSTGANSALSNLASVSINTSLLAQAGVDLGSTLKPFRDLYLFGGGTYGTNYFKITGTPTAARVFTLPDLASSTFALIAGAQTFSGKVFDNTNIFNSYHDVTRIVAPSNPASGSLRLFANNATGKLACLDSSGADCMPSGGGGGAPALSAVTDPTGNWSLAMGANLVTLTWAGNYGSSTAWKFAGNNTSATGPLVEINTGIGNNQVPFLVGSRGGQALKTDVLNNVIIGQTGGMSGSATDGFPMIPYISSNGEPSGTPSLGSGAIALENDGIFGEYRLWAYLNSAWRLLTPTGRLYDSQSGTGAQTIDWSLSRESIATRTLSMTGNVTLTFTSPLKSGVIVTLVLVQDATGSRLATWPASVKWPSGTAPTLSTGANKKDVFQFVWAGTNYYSLSQSIDVR